MARTKSTIPYGNFTFKNKPNAKGKRTLYLRYFLNEKSVMISTGVSIDPSEWDDKKDSIKHKNPLSSALNSRLRKQKVEIDQRITMHREALTLDVLRQIINDEYVSEEDLIEKMRSYDFVDYALDHNKTRYRLEKIAYSTYSNDNYNIRKFQSFLADTTGETALPLCELSTSIIDKYKEYCLVSGNKKQSINKKLKPLFKAVENAAKNDLIPSRIAFNICYRYCDLRNRKYESTVQNEKINYLTQSQIQEFIDLYPLIRHDRTREYMDMFLFSYYACGLRFSDILTLEWQHIDWDNKFITKNLYKEKIPHYIPIMDAAIEILKRWKRNKYNNRFVFNLLPENFDLNNAAILDNKRKNKARAMNTSLQEVGHKLPTPLTFNLSIHVARHTFAVTASNGGMSTHVLSKLLGHLSIASTEKFYAKFHFPNLAEEFRMISL